MRGHQARKNPAGRQLPDNLGAELDGFSQDVMLRRGGGEGRGGGQFIDDQCWESRSHPDCNATTVCCAVKPEWKAIAREYRVRHLDILCGELCFSYHCDVSVVL